MKRLLIHRSSDVNLTNIWCYRFEGLFKLKFDMHSKTHQTTYCKSSTAKPKKPKKPKHNQEGVGCRSAAGKAVRDARSHLRQPQQRIIHRAHVAVVKLHQTRHCDVTWSNKLWILGSTKIVSGKIRVKGVYLRVLEGFGSTMCFNFARLGAFESTPYVIQIILHIWGWVNPLHCLRYVLPWQGGGRWRLDVI